VLGSPGGLIRRGGDHPTRELEVVVLVTGIPVDDRDQFKRHVAVKEVISHHTF
jgi:hypothetical protein